MDKATTPRVYVRLIREGDGGGTGPKMTALQAVAEELAWLQDEVQECFVVLPLTTGNRALGHEILYRGTLNAAPVRPAEVFRVAILANAASIVVAHNHPSGDPAPSASDIAITRDLVRAGKLLGIELVDHVILGAEAFRSLREEGTAWGM